ncbi:hypothetical protein ACN28S_67815 [Cystobacter fuscus]
MILGDCEHLSWLKGLQVGDPVWVRPLPNGRFTFWTYVTAVVRGGVAVNWGPAAQHAEDNVRLFSMRSGKEKDVSTKRHYIVKP